MKTEFYNKHNLDFKERRNKIGRFILFLSFFVSTFLTLTITFFMIINNLGISPSDEQGYKTVRPDVASEILSNLKPNKIEDGKYAHSVTYQDNVLYYIEVEDTEESLVYKQRDIIGEYKLTLDKLTSTYEETGKDTLLLGKIHSYEEALKFVETESKNYIETYRTYNSKYYKNIISNPDLRYYYNSEKKRLKFALPKGEYIIIDDSGTVLKGVVNVRGENNPLYYSVSNAPLVENNENSLEIL